MTTLAAQYQEEYSFERDHRRIALITAITIMAMLLLLLLFLTRGEGGGGGGGGNGEVGLMFGTFDAGTGELIALSNETSTPEQTPQPEQQPTTDAVPITNDAINDVVSQEHEEAPVLAPSNPKPTVTPPRPVETPPVTKPVETPKPVAPKPADKPKPPAPAPGSTFGGFGSGGGAGNQGDPSGTGTGTGGTGPGSGGSGPGSGGGSGGGNGSGIGPGDGPGSGPGSGGGTGGGHYLGGRSALKQIKPDAKNNASGTVRIKITVNSQGKVINAVYSSQGSTTADSYLKQISIEAAMKWEWSPNNAAPEQMGYIDFKYAPR